MRRVRHKLTLVLLALALAAPAQAHSSPFGSDMRGVIDRSGMPPSSRMILHEALVQNRRAVSDPLEVSRLSRLMSEMLSAGRRDELSRLSLEAVRAGRLETIGQPLAMSLAVNAVDAAMVDAPDLVPDLLGRIDSPDTLVRFLALRRYEAIWPQVETRLGPGQQTVLADLVSHERAGFTGNQDDTLQLFRLASALYTDHQYAATVDLVSDWRQRHRRAEIDQNLAWAINQQAFALFRLGRVDEALAAMDELAALPDGRRGWVISFAINWAQLLLANERLDAALEASRQAGRMRGTDYARLLISRNRACSLQRLGRLDEAMRELPLLRASLRVSVYSAGSGMLCLGQREALVADLGRLLADEELAQDNFGLLQIGEDGDLEDPPQGQRMTEVIAAEPALRALLERWARAIPPEFRQAS